MALTSDHWPNFCDVFVNVMFGVIVLLITACLIERKRKNVYSTRRKKKNIFREREREREKKKMEEWNVWNVRRVRKQLEKKCEVKMEWEKKVRNKRKKKREKKEERED